MTVSNKSIIDFKRVKKDGEKYDSFEVNVNESIELIAPEGYYFVDPTSGLLVKRIVLSNYLVTDADEAIVTDDDEEIEVIS